MRGGSGGRLAPRALVPYGLNLHHLLCRWIKKR